MIDINYVAGFCDDFVSDNSKKTKWVIKMGKNIYSAPFLCLSIF